AEWLGGLHRARKWRRATCVEDCSRIADIAAHAVRWQYRDCPKSGQHSYGRWRRGDQRYVSIGRSRRGPDYISVIDQRQRWSVRGSRRGASAESGTGESRPHRNRDDSDGATTIHLSRALSTASSGSTLAYDLARATIASSWHHLPILPSDGFCSPLR